MGGAKALVRAVRRKIFEEVCPKRGRNHWFSGVEPNSRPQNPTRRPHRTGNGPSRPPKPANPLRFAPARLVPLSAEQEADVVNALAVLLAELPTDREGP